MSDTLVVYVTRKGHSRARAIELGLLVACAVVKEKDGGSQRKAAVEGFLAGPGRK
jgi:hypothetical protein